MQNLPLHPARQEHGPALSRQRDILLTAAGSHPAQMQKALEALTAECVAETLSLTGLPISLDEVTQVATGRPSDSPHGDVISGQFDALRIIKSAAQANPSLKGSLLREVHRLSGPRDGGRYRVGPGRAQFGGATPSRPELISEQVDNLMEWLVADSGMSLHPPERAALAFARLLEISPFDRSNFRVAHLLLSFFAFVGNYPPLYFRADEADEVRQEVERAFRFDTMPLVSRLDQAQMRSLSFCLEIVGRP